MTGAAPRAHRPTSPGASQLLRRVRLLPSLAAASVVLLAVEVLLRWTTVERAMRLLRVPVSASGHAGPVWAGGLPPWAHRRVAGALALLRRRRSSDSCLPRSLLLAVLLRRLRPTVSFGWVPAPGGGYAHAWVEIDGRSLDPGLDGVTPFRWATGAEGIRP